MPRFRVLLQHGEGAGNRLLATDSFERYRVPGRGIAERFTLKHDRPGGRFQAKLGDCSVTDPLRRVIVRTMFETAKHRRKRERGRSLSLQWTTRRALVGLQPKHAAFGTAVTTKFVRVTSRTSCLFPVCFKIGC